MTVWLRFLALHNDVKTEFLYHYLDSITDCIRDKVKQGSGQPNLNTDIVKAFRFALPPLDEQDSIVGRITELSDHFGSLTTEAQRAYRSPSRAPHRADLCRRHRSD
jgi:restriction endonuclease S subunit